MMSPLEYDTIAEELEEYEFGQQTSTIDQRMHCFRVPSRLSEEDSNVSLKSGGKSENDAPREQLMAHSSDASSRKSNFSMRV